MNHDSLEEMLEDISRYKVDFDKEKARTYLVQEAYEKFPTDEKKATLYCIQRTAFLIGSAAAEYYAYDEPLGLKWDAEERRLKIIRGGSK